MPIRWIYVHDRLTGETLPGVRLRLKNKACLALIPSQPIGMSWWTSKPGPSAVPMFCRPPIFRRQPAGDWYSGTLDTTAFPYINLLGVTQFRLTFQLDDNDDLGADTVQFYSGDYSDLAYRPQLQILYSMP